MPCCRQISPVLCKLYDACLSCAESRAIFQTARTTRPKSIKEVLDSDASSIQIVSEQEHPRGPIVSIKRPPDATHPAAYIDFGDHPWEPDTLTLNLYGFLDSGTMGGIREPIVKALGIREKQLATFTRF